MGEWTPHPNLIFRSSIRCPSIRECESQRVPPIVRLELQVPGWVLSVTPSAHPSSSSSLSPPTARCDSVVLFANARASLWSSECVDTPRSSVGISGFSGSHCWLGAPSSQVSTTPGQLSLLVHDISGSTFFSPGSRGQEL